MRVDLDRLLHRIKGSGSTLISLVGVNYARGDLQADRLHTVFLKQGHEACFEAEANRVVVIIPTCHPENSFLGSDSILLHLMPVCSDALRVIVKMLMEMLMLSFLGGQAQVLAVALPNWTNVERKVESPKDVPLIVKVQKPKKSESEVKSEQVDWIKRYMAQQAEDFEEELEEDSEDDLNWEIDCELSKKLEWRDEKWQSERQLSFLFSKLVYKYELAIV